MYMSDQGEPIDLGALRWWSVDWLVHLIAEHNFVTITPLVIDREAGAESEPCQLDALAVRLPALRQLQKDVEKAIEYLERGAPPSSTRTS